ncbi:hypothetical protein [Agromyces bauzanensis]|uniref:Uncharacterized protein n=1 Tax=Agromyces bauzanensis TaxID=1308924 RepID=A0A917PI83_9MICO|nr:hypothetical protein [Agromyces bauzanensis]GGJ79454.1 hypothetical protein GCM10011372_17250 [Agromyces bauzanensis]
MSMVTAADAAAQLGVTRRRIAELWGAGDLRGRKYSSGLLIELSSVHERQAIGPIEGRPWAEDVVWGVITSLSGAEAGSNAEVRRRIASNDALSLGRRIAAAVITARFDARRPDLVRDALALTGESALDRLHERSTVRVVGDSNMIHGYAPAGIDAVISQYDLIESLTGEIIVHGFRSGEPRVHGATPLALVAADCLRSPNTRVRRAGLDAIERMRTAWQTSGT